MVRYFFEINGQKIFLFKSQFVFRTDVDCLNHYERGVKAGIFNLNLSNVIQLWSSSGLALWGLVGRTRPVELIRILKANGGRINTNESFVEDDRFVNLITPVQYLVPMSMSEYEIVEPIINIQLGGGTDIGINPFLFLEDKLVLGSCYLEKGKNSDSSFSFYCQSLEKDHCFPHNSIRYLLAKLFFLGFKFEAKDNNKMITLAEYDLQNLVIKGASNEQALFYITGAKAIRL